jgi:CRP-like cAMP-binding protein
MATTTRHVGDDAPVAVDDHDEAAKAGVKRQRARKASARRKDEPSPRVKRTAVERLDDPPPATGPLLIERVTRAIERELSLIEVIVGGSHLKLHQRTEAERRARTLASLARTLGEVTRLRAGQQKVKPANDDAVPRDLDEFRRTLSRRLEQLVAGPTALPAPGNE